MAQLAVVFALASRAAPGVDARVAYAERHPGRGAGPVLGLRAARGVLVLTRAVSIGVVSALFVVWLLVVMASAADAALPRTILWSPTQVPAKYQEFLGGSRMPTPRGIVEVHIGFCPWFAAGTVGGCAFGDEIWLDAKLRPGEDEVVLFHELGHIADFRHLTEGERDRVTRILKLDGLPWWGREDAYVSPTAPIPAEFFAEAYADCATQGFYVIPSPDPPATFGFNVTPRSVCRVIGRMVRS